MRSILFAAGVLVLSGASAQQFKSPVTSLGPVDAALLVTSEAELFKSAAALAAQRPTVRAEIAELELETLAGNGLVTGRSIIRFTKLPGGLQHYHHALPMIPGASPLYESGIDVYGMGGVMYWNSRISYQQGIIGLAPSTLRVNKGRLFGTDAFTLEVTSPEGDADVLQCDVDERIPASEVHQSLSGSATIFTCSATMDVVYRHWYLEEYALYLTKDVSDEDGFLSRFRVANVKFR
ncbi:hypothetical protein [Pseudoduganella sp. HUAS MS19]